MECSSVIPVFLSLSPFGNNTIQCRRFSSADVTSPSTRGVVANVSMRISNSSTTKHSTSELHLWLGSNCHIGMTRIEHFGHVSMSTTLKRLASLSVLRWQWL